MTNTNARSARIGFATLVATILTAGLSGDAVAKAHKLDTWKTSGPVG
jgi:hypothetical protein